MSQDYDDDDDVYDQGLETLHSRADLERVRAAGCQVEADLDPKAPLGRYVAACAEKAKDALRRLTEIDPKDEIGILRAQLEVQAYLHVRAWSRGEIEASIDADETLQRDFSGHSLE